VIELNRQLSSSNSAEGSWAWQLLHVILLPLMTNPLVWASWCGDGVVQVAQGTSSKVVRCSFWEGASLPV
jgi:hypothetical protein